MRLLIALGVAAVALVPVAPAQATCMPVFDRYGVTVATCSAPGGEPWWYVCVRDVCL